MHKPRFYIGPMSKNIVDSIIEFVNETWEPIGLIPSRRQIEYNGGYVNNWTTEGFCSYISQELFMESIDPNLICIERDHAGPGQGKVEENFYNSLYHDCKFMDIIHVDPWKEYQDLDEGIKYTADMINYCLDGNPNLLIEIGTEEAIRKFELDEIYRLITTLKDILEPWKFERIKYLVIQCGTSLEGTNQTGNYDKERLVNMITLAKQYGLLTKEHNGDYQDISIIKEKFELGLDAINIAPEFGVIETETYLDEIIKNWDFNIKEYFWEICYKSKKWERWVGEEFEPHKQKEDLIRICGHYLLSSPKFELIRKKYQLDDKIKQNIKNKLYELYK